MVRVGDAASIDAAGSDRDPRRGWTGRGRRRRRDDRRRSPADLAGSGIPLAIVPGGTGNVLAWRWASRDDPAVAVRSIDRMVRRPVDLGRSRLASAGGPTGGDVRPERLFAVAAGVGWDARVMEATAAARKHGSGGWPTGSRPSACSITSPPCRIGSRSTTRSSRSTPRSRSLRTAATSSPGLVRPRLPIVPDDGLLDLFVLRVGNLPGGIRGALEILGRTELGHGPSGTPTGLAAGGSGSPPSRPSHARWTATAPARATSRSRSGRPPSTSSSPGGTHDLRVPVSGGRGLGIVASDGHHRTGPTARRRGRPAGRPVHPQPPQLAAGDQAARGAQRGRQGGGAGQPAPSRRGHRRRAAPGPGEGAPAHRADPDRRDPRPGHRPDRAPEAARRRPRASGSTRSSRCPSRATT